MDCLLSMRSNFRMKPFKQKIYTYIRITYEKELENIVAEIYSNVMGD